MGYVFRSILRIWYVYLTCLIVDLLILLSMLVDININTIPTRTSVSQPKFFKQLQSKL